MNIYVGNLPYNTTEEELQGAFAAYGQVDRVKIVQDKYTGRSRGFGFVEMQDEAGADAIANLDGKDFSGRQLRVTEAKPRPEGQRD